jgi:hypothetical protein
MKLFFSILIFLITISAPLLFAQETDEDIPPDTSFPPLSSSIILVRPGGPLPAGAVPAAPPVLIENAERNNAGAVVREPVAPPQPAVVSASGAITPITQTPQAPSTPPVPRTVHGFVGQLVEILFQGSGWVYLGEAESRNGVIYNSRRVEKNGQCLVFRAENAGTYTLRFYKQDFIRDELINEEIRLVVSEVNGRQEASWTSGTVDQNTSPASDIAEITPPPGPPASSETPVIPPAAASSRIPVDYLQQAREAYTNGKFSDALAALEEFREHYPLGSDEAWWLYGQTLEANSDLRDIRSSVDYYRRLLREYPQSPLCTDAHKRVAWLERYFFIQ